MRATARPKAFSGSSWTTRRVRSSPSRVLARIARRAIVVVSNFTPVTRNDYRLGLPRAGRWREILNSDAAVYGGSGLGNLGAIHARAEAFRDFPASAEILLPPLATFFFAFESDDSMRSEQR